jgi:hypothetical protein
MVPFADAVALNKPDDHAVLAIYKRGGKAVLTERWVLSRDRRLLTMTQTEENPKGKGFLNILVYVGE